MESLYSNAIICATIVHNEQYDKLGKPYILHPIRVSMNPILTTEIEKAVAVLHDVIEDYKGTYEQAISFMKIYVPQNVIDIVDILSKKPDIDYADYICNISDNDIAVKVKIADIQDNMSRIDCLPNKKDRERLRVKYTRALTSLL